MLDFDLAALYEVETKRLKELEIKYNKQFDDVFEAINYLLKKDTL